MRHQPLRPALAVLLGASVALASLSAGPAKAQTATAQAVPVPRLFEGSQIITEGRISVEVIGQGPDLVLIPGLASSRETWRATAERLKGRYRLHLVQIAGFAGEPARDNATGPVLAPAAEAIDAYIVAQKLSPAVVIGHSLGGTIALYLADHHPDHLRKVLIVDALPFYGMVFGGPQATVQAMTPIATMIRNGPPMPKAQSDQMIAAMVSAPADRDRVSGWSKASAPSVVANAAADDLTLDLRPDLASIKTPITLLYPDNVPNGMPAGTADGFYTAAFAPLPNKTLVRIDQSRHFIMFDQPAAFDKALDAFLGS